MYDLKKIIEANTVEGVIDYEKVMGDIDNGYVNPIVAKKSDKSKLIPEVTASLIKELGITGESIDDVKLYVKQMGGSTDEIKEAKLALDEKYKELEAKYNSEVETRTALETEATNKHQLELINSLGVTEPSQVEFLKWKFTKEVTEDKDFDTVVAEYAKEKEVTTTAKFVKDPFGAQGNKSLDIAEAWKAKRAHTRK